MNNTPVVRVGIACFIWKDGKFLMGQRQGSHGANTWSVPGGHLEMGESWEAAAKREVLEETGMHIENIRFFAITNDVMPETDKHYISIWLAADWKSGEPAMLEPDKYVEQGWYDIATLPQPLFEPCWQNLRAAKPEFFA